MIDKYLWPDDPWACAEPELVQCIYTEKLRIAELVQAKSVLEIGVRAGYFAAMFLSAGANVYTGLDATDTWGGTPGAVDFARESLPRHFPSSSITIHTVSSQTINSLKQYGTHDLIHIDGDHSLEGCLHDLYLALLADPKWILIDDTKYMHETCGIAAYSFTGKHRLPYIILDTIRGDMLIQVRQ